MLITKYRPQTWEEFLGNEEAIKNLRRVLGKPNHHHCYLITGRPATGKTTLARLIAKELGIDGMNLYEYNAANTRGIDTIRYINSMSMYAALGGGSKLYLMDEAHSITYDAQNAMLRLLEEPPSHVYFVLCTTEPSKLLDTVRERCYHIKLQLMKKVDIEKHVQHVARKEGIKLTKRDLKYIIDTSGGVRSALMLLHQF